MKPLKYFQPRTGEEGEVGWERPGLVFLSCLYMREKIIETEDVEE